MKVRLFFSLWLSIFTTGCSSQTHNFSMAVKNDLHTPVSVCITKTYGPSEAGWEAPEDLAGPPHAPTDQTPPGIVIPPGKTLTTPPFTGRFERSHGRAILRIYAGSPTLTQMNAMSIGSLNRIDVPLNDGENKIKIHQSDDGMMVADHINGPWPSTQPGQR